MLRTTAIPIICLLICLSSHSFADDWPQILGPNRNGISLGEKLLENLDAPKTAWSSEVGQGYAGPAVKSNRVFVFHQMGDKEILECRKLATGELVWKSEGRETSYQGGINPDEGPRCVPTVDKDSVVVFGVDGVLSSFELETGKKRFAVDLFRQFKANEGYFGAGSSPVIVDEKILVNVGGRDGAGIVAINKSSGKVAWKSTNEKGSYSSPISVSKGEQQFAIFTTRLNTVAVDPKTGKRVFSIPFGERGPTVNGANPIFFENKLLLSASYRIGAVLYDLNDFSKPKKLWANDESLSSQYTTSVFHDGYLYGTNGREDGGPIQLNCVDAKNGKVIWSHREQAMCHVILVGDQILAIDITGKVRVIKADPAKYTELSTFRVFDAPARSLPALSNGYLLIRANAVGGKGKLKCVEVGEH